MKYGFGYKADAEVRFPVSIPLVWYTWYICWGVSFCRALEHVCMYMLYACEVYLLSSHSSGSSRGLFSDVTLCVYLRSECGAYQQ